jgi:pimeloyl-ACP methyl ester carboxylesterase
MQSVNIHRFCQKQTRRNCGFAWFHFDVSGVSFEYFALVILNPIQFSRMATFQGFNAILSQNSAEYPDFPPEVFMQKFRFVPSLILLLLLISNACATASTVTPSATAVPPLELSPTLKPTATKPIATVVPSQEPTPTYTSEPPDITITPVESAFAPGNPTAAPLDDILERHTVTFETPDGATITGELYGVGKTAVIFSVMGNCKQGWREFAQLTAAQGLMALTFLWRDCDPSGPANEAALIQNFVNDARGAVNFVRAQGAEQIILAGASLGGVASAKLAVESQASGIIVFAAPLQIPGSDFKVEAAELNTDIPKLFLTAEEDYVVPPEDSRALYDLAAEPKEWQIYPGNEHGTELFSPEIGGEIQLRMLEFILGIASTN